MGRMIYVITDTHGDLAQLRAVHGCAGPLWTGQS